MAHTEDLLKAFDTSAQELRANRAGRLGNRQARGVRSVAWASLLNSELLVGALIGIVYISSNGTPEPSQHVVAGVLGLIGVLVAYRAMRRPFAASRAGVVECLTGPVAAEQRGRGEWRLTVAGRTLRLFVDPAALAGGASYRVYVAPAVAQVVAMEPDGWE
jgi:xanthosine utilization system XapX-like protein